MQKFRDLVGGKSSQELQKEQSSETPLDLPPTYEESHQGSQNAPDYGPSSQQGYNGYPEDKKEAPQYPQGDQGGLFSQPQGYNQGYQQQTNYDPMNVPNVYKVAPQKVNITQANPQHLNPQYQEYLARDQERIKQGDYPKGREFFKRGAPLNENRVNPKNKTGGSSFPGSAGATYHDAANR